MLMSRSTVAGQRVLTAAARYKGKMRRQPSKLRSCRIQEVCGWASWWWWWWWWLMVREEEEDAGEKDIFLLFYCPLRDV